MYVGFEGLTAAVMKGSVSCDITPCSPLKVNLRRISRERNLRILPPPLWLISCSVCSPTLKMETTCSSETQVDTQELHGVISQMTGPFKLRMNCSSLPHVLLAPPISFPDLFTLIMFRVSNLHYAWENVYKDPTEDFLRSRMNSAKANMENMSVLKCTTPTHSFVFRLKQADENY
jgi:hypothetical protein